MYTRIFSPVIALLVANLVSAVFGQDFPQPQPGAEHKFLKLREGTWETTLKMPGAPDAKGAAIYKMELGGLWLTGEFVSDFAGTKFEGRGLDTYDPATKKFISVWVDSMVTSPYVTEGQYDEKTKTLTMTGDMPEPDGKRVKTITKTVFTDENTMEFTMYDGQEQQLFQVIYKRKK